MDRDITRRDFVHGAGVAAAAGAIALKTSVSAAQTGGGGPGPVGYARGASPNAESYPPIRGGLRGSHEGSYTDAHALSWDGKSNWGDVHFDDRLYDLVVVGAGLSGLSAAYFYREQRPDARILILDNHDDFGGHAKRNEFQIGNRTVLGYGGSQSLEEPGAYSDVVKSLLKKLAVDTDALSNHYDVNFYKRHNLGARVFFDRETFGADHVSAFPAFDASGFVPAAVSDVSIDETIAQMPLSNDAKQQLMAINSLSEDKLPGVGIFGEPDFLSKISYRDFLTDHLAVTDDQVLKIYQDIGVTYFGSGIDALPAFYGLMFGLPGLQGTSLGFFEGLIRRAVNWTTEPYTYHFPDGNASLARLLVRSLIPGIAPGNTMEDVVPAPFDYTLLDRPENNTRIRLNSTAINVEHDEGAATGDVIVTYVRSEKPTRIRARNCVLACYGVIVPYICPTLPAEQRAALATQSKAPLVYTNVLLRNWHAVKQQGIGVAHCPGSWHQLAMADFPVSMGDYSFARDPSQPLMMCLTHVPTEPGLPPREQYKIGRQRLLDTSFETIERHVRTHMAGMLGAAGFDAAEDILGIIANRHPHGYAYSYNPLFDPEYEDGQAPHEIGRRTFGRIAIANSDAGARAYLDEAIDQAWRAVGDLT
jgi:spermidine dehydrogenase